jgi:DnaJ-class molecular chaperone
MGDHPDAGLVDWYAHLEVSPDASSAEIDDAYRRLVRALHPDSAGPHSVDVARLQAVIEAHDVLSNPARRRAYDQRGTGRREHSAPRALRQCPVCRGTGAIATPCSQCRTTGYQGSTSRWLQVARACRMCQGTGHRLTLCGACAATGYTARSSQ